MSKFLLHCDSGYLPTTEKNDWRRIPAHYEPLPEFEAVFSDESLFQLCPDDHRRRIWRRPGLRADPAFTIVCRTGPQPEVMVWSAVSFDCWISLVVIRDLLTAQRFIDDILRIVLLPFILQYLGLIF
ncbi:transposable element Tc1 transposase [Trichonephila clavipes]|uniref:Transposable element Tc1 transposase n=1 Tax=Trichonephila clavipes TaxID=2585209 RepID=A0A8X6VFI1_TRICX|nr:transposable element Tc1 transposase [Trichonephila clavipes]